MKTADREHLRNLANKVEHTLRCEVQLRTPVLGRPGLQLVGALSDGTIEELHRSYFHRAGFAEEVSSLARVRKLYLNAAPSVQKSLPALVGMLVLESLGLPMPGAKGTRSKYRRLAKDLQLSMVDLKGGDKSYTLDYDSGKLSVTYDRIGRATQPSTIQPSVSRASPQLSECFAGIWSGADLPGFSPEEAWGQEYWG